MSNPGLIQVYTGDGKGKTTASLGLALRAAGHGLKIFVIQFMKSHGAYGEAKVAGLLPGLTIIAAGREGLVNLKDPEPADRKLAEEGWELAKKIISAGEAELVVLDEINVAMACGLVDVNEVVAFLKDKKYQAEIILTGRGAPAEITDIAHLVTEMRKIRHPFDQNISPRRGIDY